MRPSPPTVADDGSPWAWLPLGLLLACTAQVDLTEAFSFSFEPGFLLPPMAAFLAFRFGRRAAAPLMALALPAMFSGFVRGDALWLYFGFAPESYLLAVCAALAFVRPAPRAAGALLAVPLRRFAQAALVILTVAVYLQFDADAALGDALRLRVDPGALLAVLLLAAAVRWREAAARLRAALARGAGALRRLSLTAFATLGTLALLARIDYDGDWLGVRFGLSAAAPWLFALSFACAAAAVVSWRWLLALLLAGYLGEAAWAHWWAALQSTQAGGGEPAALVVTGTRLRDYRHWSELIDCASAAVLGAVVAPFWRQRLIAPLRHGATPLLLGAVLALQFLGQPAGAGPGFGFSPFALGGFAFLCGLVWRGRGVIAAPVVIQLGCLLAYAAFKDDLRAGLVSECVRLGAIAFPFAFLGLLANRSERQA